MTASRTTRVRLLRGTATGALALGALVAAPPGATAAAPGAAPGQLSAVSAVRAAAPRPTTTEVGTEQQLRRAVARANRRPGTDRIRFTATIAFSKAGSPSGGALRGDLDVHDDLIVLGGDRALDANDVDRAFDVRPDTRLVVRDLRIIRGAPAAGTNGGGIRSGGALTLTRTVVAHSDATGEAASGGAVANEEGTLRVVESRLSNSTADRAGGAIEAVGGQTTVLDSELLANSTGAMPGNGGGLHLTGAGTVLVSGSRVAQNDATAEGVGLWNSAEGTFDVVDTRVNRNTAAGPAADQGGGGLFNDGGTMTVSGSDVWANDATGAAGSGGGILNNLGTLEVSDSVLNDNSAPRAGGGIEANVGETTVTGSTLSGNQTGAAPGNGGGLHLTGAGTVDVTDSEVTDNTAAAEGGGLWNSATGTFTVTDTELTGNSAAGVAADQGGGALFNDGGAMSVTGSTISDNEATGTAGSGGGILNNLGALEVTDTTLSGNSAPRAGGAIETNVGTATLEDVDMSGNDTGANPGNGGGLHLTGAAVVTYTGGSVTGNSAANEGGGLWNSSTGTLTATVDIVDNGNTARPQGGPNGYQDDTAPVTGTFTLNGEVVPPGDPGV